MDKVEDPVLGRFESRNESGPGNRALRGCRCAEPAEMPLITKPCQVWQGVPVTLYEPRIHPIHAKHNQVRAVRSMVQKAASAKKNTQEDSRRSSDVAGKFKTPAFY
jgi:hypothetical protein